MGSLRIAMFEQEIYLPNGMSLKLRFHRQRQSFNMMTNDGKEFRIGLEQAYMQMRKVKPAPGVQFKHAEAIMKMLAKFPITHKETKMIAMSKDVYTFVKDNIFLWQLPKQLVIAIVDRQAFMGDMTLNPFNFQHMIVNFM